MPTEEYFNLYKKCVDVQSMQFTLEDFKRFAQSSNIKIIKKRNCIAILGLTDSEIEIYFIGVEEKFRGKGLGRRLLKNVISFSKDYRAFDTIICFKPSGRAITTLCNSSGALSKTTISSPSIKPNTVSTDI